MPLTKIAGGQTLTVSSTAIGISRVTGFAVVEIQTAAIRYRVDGRVPTATGGHVGNIGDVVELTNPQQVGNFQAIRQDGTDATLEITYGLGHVA